MMAKRSQHRAGQLKKRAGKFDTIAGRHIRKHRLAAGLSQTGLGAWAGVTFQQVQKYENGRNRMSLPMFARISKVYANAGIISASELLADIMREAEGG